LGIQWNLTQQITTRILTAKQAFTGPCFMEIIGCAAWNIWKMRNDMIFEGQNASINRWKVRVQGDILLHCFKVKSMLVQPLINWMLEILCNDFFFPLLSSLSVSEIVFPSISLPLVCILLCIFWCIFW
jgi:hypothetical protein